MPTQNPDLQPENIPAPTRTAHRYLSGAGCLGRTSRTEAGVPSDIFLDVLGPRILDIPHKELIPERGPDWFLERMSVDSPPSRVSVLLPAAAVCPASPPGTGGT